MKEVQDEWVKFEMKEKSETWGAGVQDEWG
jgi:hypothetical protein